MVARLAVRPVRRDPSPVSLRFHVQTDREHFRCDGVAKTQYEGRAKAETARRKAQTRDGGSLQVYKCPVCRYYHLGHKRVTTYRHKQQSTVYPDTAAGGVV